MKKIDVWLDLFSKYWKKQQIENMLTLFTDDLEFWETPFKKIKNKILLEKEWQGIKAQKEIEIGYAVFNEEDNKYTVLWDREFIDKDGQKKHLRGIYLIRLNIEGKCDYFFAIEKFKN